MKWGIFIILLVLTVFGNAQTLDQINPPDINPLNPPTLDPPNVKENQILNFKSTSELYFDNELSTCGTNSERQYEIRSINDTSVEIMDLDKEEKTSINFTCSGSLLISLDWDHWDQNPEEVCTKYTFTAKITYFESEFDKSQRRLKYQLIAIPTNNSQYSINETVRYTKDGILRSRDMVFLQLLTNGDSQSTILTHILTELIDDNDT